jgi:hypothetical protein
MVINTAWDEVLPLGIDYIISRDVGYFCTTYNGCYAVILDKYATYKLLAFVYDSGLLNQGGHGSF